MRSSWTRRGQRKLGDEDNDFKFKFDREMIDHKVILPVIGKTLVRIHTPPGDIGQIASPDWLRFV